MAARTVPFAALNLASFDDLISVMEGFLGYLEKANGNDLGNFTAEGKVANAGYNNYTIYWDWYKTLGYGNLQTEPYCAGFVSTVLATGYGLDKAKKLLCGNLFIYCPDGYNQFNAKGRVYSSPKKGDIVLFWSSSLGRWGHTGFVVGVDATGYTTIEANTTSGNDVVVRNGGATCRKHYTNGQTKVAFLRPPYEENGITIDKQNATPAMVTYAIGTSESQLTIVADSINVRSTPGTDGALVGSLSAGAKVVPTLKTFINGDPWIYIPNSKGWISGKYVEGWMQEFTCNNKWWYVTKGYGYYTNAIVEINDRHYYFDAAGYMFEGTISFTTDENGALKISK